MGLLPPEIADYIMALLPAEDLWTCLTVSLRWRQIANRRKYWDQHFVSAFGIDPPDEESDGSTDDLCTSAEHWSKMMTVINHWTNHRFKKCSLPEQLRNTKIYLHENYVALHQGAEINTYIIDKNLRLFCSAELKLPCFLDKPIIIENGVILMNKQVIVFKSNVFLVIYWNAGTYVLTSVTIFKVSGDMEVVLPNQLSQDLYQLGDYENWFCEFCYLFDDKLWISYSIDFCKQSHFLVDLKKSEVKKIIPPIEKEVIKFTGEDHTVILQFDTSVIVYDIEGNIVFQKDVGKKFICVTTNENMIAIIDSQIMRAYDITTGRQVLKINLNS